MHVFDTLYVISDLHLGGVARASSGYSTGPLPVQACGRGERLGAWIRSICPKAPEKSVGLVINGDFVDFLAENPTHYLDPLTPHEHLSRVADDPSFRGVFMALREFVAAPTACLIIVLGNHDVEMMVPEAQRTLLELLGHPPANRVEFAVDGTGYTCLVGGRRVYCTHGNEHDAWNIVDFRAIRRLLRRVKSGTVPRRSEIAEVTNAGTRLVVDVMNEFKPRFPFIDLLKPEIDSVIPLLASVVEGDAARRRVWAGVDLLKRLATDSVRGSRGLLSGDTRGDGVPSQVSNEWKGDIERLYQQQRSPLDLALEEGGGTLGIGTALWGTARSMASDRGLRGHLLDVARSDRSFAPQQEDETFSKIDDEVDPRVDFIVAGHTHLARQIRRRNGGGFYFNSGTWMRLLKLGEALLSDDRTWAEARKVLLDDKVEPMETFFWKDAPEGIAEQDRRLFLDRCTVVMFSHDTQEGTVRGGLFAVTDDDGLGTAVRLVPDPVSQISPVMLKALKGDA